MIVACDVLIFRRCDVLLIRVVSSLLVTFPSPVEEPEEK